MMLLLHFAVWMSNRRGRKKPTATSAIIIGISVKNNSVDEYNNDNDINDDDDKDDDDDDDDKGDGDDNE